uniref:Uncharacterized protein n=1 Tax=Rhizophora mucronata TaxID=61149 RepID=A0A2P2JJT7_RHIMU
MSIHQIITKQKTLLSSSSSSSVNK